MNTERCRKCGLELLGYTTCQECGLSIYDIYNTPTWNKQLTHNNVFKMCNDIGGCETLPNQTLYTTLNDEVLIICKITDKQCSSSNCPIRDYINMKAKEQYESYKS